MRSIRYKFLLGFLCIFILSFVAVQFFLRSTIDNNIEKALNSDLLNLRKDSFLYLDQYFSNRSIKMSSENFDENIDKITEELCNKLESRVVLYSKDGKLLSDSINEDGNIYVPNTKDYKKTELSKEDLKLAINNKIAYTINPFDNMYIVNCSFPVSINSEAYGILRISKDYTQLYKENYKLLRNIDIAVLIILLLVFLFSFLFSEKIIVPLYKLNEAANHISKGNYDYKIENESKDEIGELTDSFLNMQNKIRSQIKKITEEKDEIVKLEQYRKEFFDNATHEMKTPLTVISGYAQILLNKGFEDKVFFERAVKNIKSESERMHEFVVQLLNISKMGREELKNEFSCVSINEVLEEVSTYMAVKADKYNIKLKLSIEDSIKVNGNKNALKQVFINLIDNSIKYGAANTDIKIICESEAGYCFVTIKDKGIGIEEEKLQKIFHAFYRGNTENSTGNDSYGLGLTIVKTILDNHNAEIKIDSVVNQETKVIIKIPQLDNNLAISS